MDHLERIKNFVLASDCETQSNRLSDLFGDNQRLAKAKFEAAFKGEIGLYAFVWTGKIEELEEQELILKGKKKLGENNHHLHYKITWRHKDFPKGCDEVGRYPLYIGKTTIFRKRISQHLRLKTETWKKQTTEPYPDETGSIHGIMLDKPTSTCQFRSGIEHLFPGLSREQLLEKFKKIELCFLPTINGHENQGIKDRFYLENLAIGYFRPWFNVDSER